MKYLLLLFLLAISFNLFSQRVIETNEYTTETGWKIKLNDSVILGPPSRLNFYQYIKENKSDRKHNKYLTGNYQNQKVLVDGISEYKWSNDFYEVFCKIRFNEVIYYINLDSAIFTNEMIIPDEYKIPSIPSIKNDKGYYFLNSKNLNVFIDSLQIKENDLIFENVIMLDGYSKEQIFSRLRSLFVELFNDSKNVLEINDKELGQLMGKGKIKYKHSNLIANNTNFVSFTINILVKDGRFKYRINNLKSDYYADTKYGDYSSTHREYLPKHIIDAYKGVGIYSKGISKLSKSFVKEQIEDFINTIVFLNNTIIKKFDDPFDDMDDF